MTNKKEIDVLGFSDETIEWWKNLVDEHGEDFSDLDEKERKELTMWRNFIYEYGFDEIGIHKLREILGDPDSFKQKYIN